MATGAANPNRQTQSSAVGPADEANQFIQRQLDQTRRRVKFMDLVTAILTLAAGSLSFLMLAAAVDHWLLELGFWGRLAAFAMLLVGAGWYFFVAILPLLLYRINPVYAAQAIERSSPTLKNSLINFLLLRSNPSHVHRAVYQEMGRRAATDLQTVDVDMSVDRRRLLTVAYVLIGVLTLCAAYRILSPKNPFQSFSRVMIPWADIARPARLEIVDVEPGEDLEIYFGRNVEISAGLRVHSGDRAPMQLVYSSADRQIERQVLEMEWLDSENRYRIELPGTATGVQQDLTYELLAGDAKAGPYRLNTIAAPTILVQRVEYEPPPYTGQSSRTSQQPDVSGLEGTRVTVHARANQRIQAAYIEFDPTSSPNSSQASAARSELAEMSVDGDRAWGSFVLKFTEDRRRPLHSSYQVWFLAEDKSRRSENALIHDISVSRDLPPVVDVLNPKRSQVELPLDSALQIEVRGLDPDFGLNRIRLRAVAGGTEVLKEERTYDSRLGQVIETFDFVPRKLNLKVGDVVKYRAAAEDNRQDVERRVSDPNIEQSSELQITITAPRNRDANSTENQSDEPAAKQPPAESPESESPDEASQSEGGDPSQGSGSDDSKEEDPDAQSGQEGDQKQDEEASEKGEPQSGDSGSGQPEEDSDAGNSQPGESASPDSGTESGTESGGAGSEEGTEKGGSSGDPQDAQQGTGSGTPSDSGETTPSDGGGEPSGPDDGSRSSGTGGGDTTGQGGPTRDLREDPLHDGEVIERVKEYLDQQQDAQSDQQTGEGDASGQSDSNAPQDAGPNAGPNAGQDPGNSPMPSPKPSSPTGAGEDASPGDADQQRGQGEKQPGDARGEGGDPQGPMDRKDPMTKPDESQSPKSKPGMGDNGASGAGSPAASEQGSAESQGENQDREKQMQPDDNDQPKESEAQSPTNSRRQSDSQGDQGGDRSGGGQQGPGQSAQRKGNDSAGSQSDADQGAGASDSSGQGDTASRPGQQEQAEDPTGAPGSDAGPGSSSRKQPNQQPGADDANQPPDASPQDPGTGSPQRQAESSGTKPAGNSGQVTGGGVEGDPANNRDPSRQPNTPPPTSGDEPNLEYAREATDLVLEYLEDQQQGPDPKLLDELGWTEEDMGKFVERWKNLKQNAQQQGDDKQLKDALKSLGLRPEQDSVRRARSENDQTRGLRQSGNRSTPPPAFLEQFNAARRGVAKGANDRP